MFFWKKGFLPLKKTREKDLPSNLLASDFSGVIPF